MKDAALKARMARHYTCFLKRLRLFHITNLSKNVRLQADLAGYLAQGLVNKDPGDPDLAKTDDIWGFYLPQYNVNSAANYPRACPDQPLWGFAGAKRGCRLGAVERQGDGILLYFLCDVGERCLNVLSPLTGFGAGEGLPVVRAADRLTAWRLAPAP